MGETIYSLRDVAVDLGGHRVLEVKRLDIDGAGVTAVVGPNGAGKSTLLRVLAFLLPPVAGEVRFRGAPVQWTEGSLRRLRRQATLVAQQPYLFRRSVEANLTYGLHRHGLPAGERVAAALATVGLDGFGQRAAEQLSGGEAQRVALARAIVLEPAVLLLDEPMTAVDRSHVGVIEEIVRSLGARGTAVVLTTHDLGQAHALADRVISLAQGDITPAPLVNVLRGETVLRDGIRYCRSAAAEIELTGEESPRVISIDPDAVVLSRAPLASSARNCFAGEVRRVERDRRGLVVTVDCGASLVAHITEHSYAELELNVGAPVWVSFKTSAVQPLG